MWRLVLSNKVTYTAATCPQLTNGWRQVMVKCGRRGLFVQLTLFCMQSTKKGLTSSCNQSIVFDGRKLVFKDTLMKTLLLPSLRICISLSFSSLELPLNAFCLLSTVLVEVGWATWGRRTGRQKKASLAVSSPHFCTTTLLTFS